MYQIVVYLVTVYKNESFVKAIQNQLPSVLQVHDVGKWSRETTGQIPSADVVVINAMSVDHVAVLAFPVSYVVETSDFVPFQMGFAKTYCFFGAGVYFYFPMHGEVQKVFYKNHKAFRGRVKGKTVIFVGPATTLDGKGLGCLIDEYDFVVRTNDGADMAEKRPEDYGARSDILFLNNSWCRRKLKNFEFPEELEFIFLKTLSVASGFKRRDLRSKLTATRNISKKSKLRHLWKEHGILKEPLQASNIAHNMMGCGVKQLTFTGLDFYESKRSWNNVYNTGLDEDRERRIRTRSHSIRGEKRFLGTLMRKGYLESDSKVFRILNPKGPKSKFSIPRAKK